ncbi:MAG: hypothetical protein MUF22_07035 [Chitinispirillaceae bacterium]|nr:hypothetical protein [Chitinispirillaceae bacterium]
MLTIRRAKSLHGKLVLPPSPDLFLLTQFVALAANRPVRISPVGDCPAIRQWAALLEGNANVSWDADACLITPSEGTDITFASPQIPYRDLVISLALGTRRKVSFLSVTPARLEKWRSAAQRFGCALEVAHDGSGGSISLAASCAGPSVRGSVSDSDVPLLLGLSFGLRAATSFSSDNPLSSPIRTLAEHFGFRVTVKREIGIETDPIERRRRLQAGQRLSSQDQIFTICSDFSAEAGTEPVEVLLPGDELLLSLFLFGKALISKGSLVIDNAPLEPWALPLLALMRKMGCRPSHQVGGKGGAFGETGMISFQKFELTGQKIDCSPAAHYAPQLPAMAMLAAFAEGETVLRRLDDIRLDEPDMLRQIGICLAAMNVKLGDMPDGIVIKGSHDHDGFDCIEPLPAALAGACTVAGLHCMGSTTVNDELLLDRWPQFHKLIETHFEYRS